MIQMFSNNERINSNSAKLYIDVKKTRDSDCINIICATLENYENYRLIIIFPLHNHRIDIM